MPHGRSGTDNMNTLSFFKDKRVLLTGHTGFKGAWLSLMLLRAGADVTGYALAPASDEPSLFSLLGLECEMRSVYGDVRDLDHLLRVYRDTQPEIVLHLAAQPIVRESYRIPRETYETNVMGTVNLLECVRMSDCTRSVVNVTTDKVYENREWVWGYRENDPLDGFDPYSNSKSCSELVTHSYRSSFLKERGVAVSTARAGNVIGGGDFAKDRIIPDCVRAALAGQEIVVRNPDSIRPFQHVLEPLAAYSLLAQRQYECPELAEGYNIGPDHTDCVTTGMLVGLFCNAWGEGLRWRVQRETNAPHEANFLKLDCTRFQSVFGWNPHWHIDEAVRRTADWSKVYRDGGDLRGCMFAQMDAFFG